MKSTSPNLELEKKIRKHFTIAKSLGVKIDARAKKMAQLYDNYKPKSKEKKSTVMSTVNKGEEWEKEYKKRFGKFLGWKAWFLLTRPLITELLQQERKKLLDKWNRSIMYSECGKCEMRYHLDRETMLNHFREAKEDICKCGNPKMEESNVCKECI